MTAHTLVEIILTESTTLPKISHWFSLFCSILFHTFEPHTEWHFFLNPLWMDICGNLKFQIVTYHMKSLQWLQNVGCLKKRGMNLWSFTLYTFFFFSAPFLPRSLKPKTVFKSPEPSSRTFVSSSAITANNWHHCNSRLLTLLTAEQRSTTYWRVTIVIKCASKIFSRKVYLEAGFNYLRNYKNLKNQKRNSFQSSSLYH